MSETEAGRGVFLTFEGGEGVGKSTQVRRLMGRLDAAGIEAMATREPGGSPWAERIRGVLLAGGARRLDSMGEAILFSAARGDHLRHTIRPALARGVWVVCDRFADSTRAYQGAAGDLDASLVATLERVVVGPTRPNLTFILDLAPEIGLSRAARRRNDRGEPVDRFEGESIEYHHRLRQAFRAIAEAEPSRCVLIDAGEEPDVVFGHVWREVTTRWPSLAQHDAKDEGEHDRRDAAGGA